jgi:hypothetical protein
VLYVATLMRIQSAFEQAGNVSLDDDASRGITETLFESKRTNKLSLILSDLTRQMVAMDRYERRALSRQKFAIRALDALRRQAALTKRIEDPAPKARTCK